MLRGVVTNARAALDAQREDGAVTHGVQPVRPRWDGLFALNSVDVVSAAIYVGVLLAHVLATVAGGAGWHTAVSVVLIGVLFAADRAEALRFPQGAPMRIAFTLLLTRLAIMSVVVLLGGSTLAWFLLLIPPFRASLYFGDRVSYVVAAITWAAFCLRSWGNPIEGPQEIILFGMALVFVCTIARALREERESRTNGEALLTELARSHAQLQAHAETVAELATTEERNRLARDIHDSLGHYLTVTNVQIAKAIAFQYRDPAVAEQAMRHAKDTAHDALGAVRQSVGALRTTRDAFVFAGAMSALVDRTRTDGVVISVHIDGNEAFFGTETLTTLYYVTQEGLTNVHKHAGASHVAIEVCFKESEATLTITDNGCGFVLDAKDDAERGADGGYGLQSMRDRLRRIGGRLTIFSTPGAGTTLTAYAPRSSASSALASRAASEEAVKA